MEIEGDGAVATETATLVDLALDAWRSAFDDLLRVVEDGGFGDHDDLGVVAVARQIEQERNRQSLVDHALVAELDGRRVAETLSQPSTAALLAWALRISRPEANRRVRAAEQVGARRSMTGEVLDPRWPALAAAQRSGQAGPEQVDLALRALATVDHRGFDPADLAAADQLLADFTAGFGPKPLTDLARQVVERLDPDGTLPTTEVDAQRRHLTWRTARDGMCVGEFRLTPALGVKLKTVLSPLAAPRNTVVGESDDGRPVTEVDPRTYGQRMHDALDDVCDRLLRSGTLPDSGGTPTTVLITTTLTPANNTADAFRRPRSTATAAPHHDQPDEPPAQGGSGGPGDTSGLPGTATEGGRTWAWGAGTASDGTHLSPDTVADLADSAAVHPTLLDAKGAVLWMGRTSRLATPAQTLALAARDGGCSFPGCEHPPEWCERHHVVAWADGGPTDLDNLTLLCRYHHRQFLARGWTCRIVDRLPTWYPPRWIDPDQRPLRNTRITTRHLVC